MDFTILGYRVSVTRAGKTNISKIRAEVDDLATKGFGRLTKINRIKATRQLFDFGLKEAKDWVETHYSETEHCRYP